MKKFLWKTHSLLGLGAGLILLIIGLTGSILVFKNELVLWELREHLTVERGPLAPGWVDTAVARVKKEYPDYNLRYLNVEDRPDRYPHVWIQKPDEPNWSFVILSPVDGAPLVKRQWQTLIAGWVLRIHYSLLLDAWGIAIVALFSIALVLSCVTGLWIYGPFLKNLFRLRWGAAARLLFSDMHRAVGIGFFVFNLMWGITGGFWNIRSVVHFFSHEEHGPEVFDYDVSKVSLDRMLSQSREKIPGLQPVWIEFPHEKDHPFEVMGNIRGWNFLLGEHSGKVMFNAKSGDFEKLEDVRDAGLWATVDEMLEPLHFGNFGGLPIKLLWSLGGITPGILTISGFLIWRARRRKKPTPAIAAATAR